MIKDLKVNKKKDLIGKQATVFQEFRQHGLSHMWPKAAQKHLKT